MKKIVNGVERDCTPEEQAKILAERKQAEIDKVILQKEFDATQAKIESIGDPTDFLINLCQFLKVQPQVIRDLNAP